MSKIKTIEVTNLKVLDFATLNLNGCSVIVTGKNDSGKSTLLRGTIDRIRGIKPSVIVKEGQKHGKSFIELTSGEKFEWVFADGKEDKLYFITDKQMKINATRAICDRFFPPAFDIDEWLSAAPQKQALMLQKLIGLDFTDVNNRYRSAFEARTIANRNLETERVKFNAMPDDLIPMEIVSATDILKDIEAVREKLNNQYLTNKQHNEALRAQWQKENTEQMEQVRMFNAMQSQRKESLQKAINAHEVLIESGYTGDEVSKWLKTLTNSIEPLKLFTPPSQPEFIEEMPDDVELKNLNTLLADLQEHNEKARKFMEYEQQKEKVKTALEKAEEANTLVKSIELEKEELIKTANLPDGIEFTDDGGISINGFPIADAQISTSLKYITALRLGSLKMGEVDALYFDASYLDHASYLGVQKWADEHGLQLLVERPDWDGGPLKYEIIESVNQ